MPAPIVLFAYNRPWHTEQTLRSLAQNYLASDSELIVYVDGPKTEATPEQLRNIENVKAIVKEQKWCKKLTIHIADVNQGLANSVIKGVTQTLQLYDSAIIIEDDMILSSFFLQFMNDGLEKYKMVEEVISIHGYSVPARYAQPVFFLKGADCWGWATWRRGWNLFNPDGQQLLKQLIESGRQYEFDFMGTYPYSEMLRKQIEGEVDSWAIRWYASAFLQSRLTLYPAKSLVQNIGSDGSGTHPQDKKLTYTAISPDKVDLIDIPIKESQEARLAISKYFQRKSGMKQKIKKWFKWEI